MIFLESVRNAIEEEEERKKERRKEGKRRSSDFSPYKMYCAWL
jgi:hypothetical protein